MATTLAANDARRLPSRPLDELPADHCMLRSKSFSYLPRKYRALVSLPPMQPHVPTVRRAELRKGRDRKSKPKQEELVAVPGCYGDFCHTEFKYPQILQDIESGTDPWSRQGRQLCQRQLQLDGHQLDTLMKPEELAACLQDTDSEAEAASPKSQPGWAPPKSAAAKSSGAAPGPSSSAVKQGLLDLPASQVLEARSHPGLCHWLRSLDWRINPEDAATVLAAAAHLASDEAAPVPRDMSKRLDVSVPGMRYRLRSLKVCRTCFNTYQVINQVITLVRHQRKDRWAKAEIERRKRRNEKEREEALEAYIQRVIGNPEERMARAASLGKCPPCLPRESSIFDPEVTLWMRDIPDTPATASDMIKVMWLQAQDPSALEPEELEAPPSSPEAPRRRRGVVGL